MVVVVVVVAVVFVVADMRFAISLESGAGAGCKGHADLQASCRNTESHQQRRASHFTAPMQPEARADVNAWIVAGAHLSTLVIPSEVEGARRTGDRIASGFLDSASLRSE